MKQWRFEISSKKDFPDIHGGDVLEDIRQLNITSVEDVVSEKVFLIEADFEQDFAERVANELLAPGTKAIFPRYRRFSRCRTVR